MQPNIELLKYLESHFHNYMDLYRFLTGSFPQLNHQTKIEFVHSLVVYVMKNYEYKPTPTLVNTRGKKARIYRALGELFGNLTLILKGKHWEQDLISPPIEKDKVELGRISCNTPFGIDTIVCGYYPTGDIFYIYERD